MMNRDDLLAKVETWNDVWDCIVIGGGASGLGVAIDASARGYSCLLLEQSDFAKGTSSRSTKLIHGGVRYLQQGDVSLVIEALHERGLLRQNAPHLVANQRFVVPSYDWWDGPFYRVGLKVYDVMAGRLGLGPSKSLSGKEALAAIPTLRTKELRGGIVYHDGQFDDARLAVNLAQTLAEKGGTPLNYMKVTGLLKAGDMVNGVTARDMETGKELEIYSRVVINATGVFVDDILKMDNPAAEDMVKPSQGVHLVVDKTFLPGDTAIMVPHTDDGRVLFAVPWQGKVVVGTTDTPVEKADLEPRALDEEIEFILNTAGKYLEKVPTESDVLSVFAGLRPLAAPPDGGTPTREISRSHKVLVSPSGLVTLAGGKWTTYRKMGEDTINKAALVAGLEERPSATTNLRIHGWLKHLDPLDPLSSYGSDIIALRRMIQGNPALADPLDPALPVLKAQVVWAVRKEMARTVEDVLSRRTRALILDARASIRMAPETAKIMAGELKLSRKWQKNQVREYTDLARGYLPGET
ncbi:MAG: glycerol-3-phosphate dehydrogenase/oxidase [Syntrophales bacterium]|jgi:glycerol-3-phosphate dehydrogenase|nr:glycerol-3-phosphate dehydrogenase/oxidase [Syntrophales bacterium]MCK9527189.1 glycerol-3-phosphate dehydrogenase/oxidase [Syntrophales bacterium]MDX9921686.1 glycerol-3-phosphate dehydrogenase/oxidase [Syntrophales bacterium]